ARPRRRRILAGVLVAIAASLAAVIVTRDRAEVVRVAAPVVRDAATLPAPATDAQPSPRVVAAPVPPAPRAHGKKKPAKRIVVAAAEPPPAPVEAIEPPVVEPAPVVVVAPPPPPVVAPPVLPPAPKPVATSARLVIEHLSVRGALTVAQVKRAVDRVSPAIRACYGPAASRAKHSPELAIHVRFELDENTRAHSIQAGEAALAGVAGCVQRAVADVRAEQPPDVGSVDVTFVAHFTPEGS
ncbi:MAG: hypothetical protein ABI678_32930, partial [Kofleriaceae bacterium]